MKNLLKYTIVAGLSVLIVATSCIKEDIPDGNSITKDQVDASPYGVEAMVSALHRYAGNANWYSTFPVFWGLPSLCFIRDTYCNDMAALDETGRDWYLYYHANQAQQGQSAYIQCIWLIYTKYLAYANDIIRMYPNVEEAAGDNKYYLGAAYAARAMAWLEMAQIYEFKENKYTSGTVQTADGAKSVVGLTIPFLHENMTEDFARNNPRLTKEEIIGYIKESLDIAIDLLDGFVSSDKTVPTQSVAYGLLARTLMWEGDYENAKIAAQNALSAGISYSPLTEEQWTSTTTGFNSVESQNSWMWCIRLSTESTVVKNYPLANITSWMASENIFGYCGLAGGTYRLCDALFYNQIPDTDWRKKSWKAPAGSKLNVPYIPASGQYPGPNALPDLAAIKFRPGSGNVSEYLVMCPTDFPLMRMEEMKFIIAECDARSGSATSLIDIVKTRNPEYTTSLTGNSLIREVLFQKRIEFWGEGILFFDYKRCPELLTINRGYKGTNHADETRFNCDGLAPWFNVCINEYEASENKGIVNNPNPSNTVDLWQE